MNDEIRKRILARRSVFIAATLVTTTAAAAAACEKTYACLEPVFEGPPTPSASSSRSDDAGAPPSLDTPAVCLSPVR